MLGKKANGTLSKLENGGGVINAKGTTLAGMFNALSQTSGINSNLLNKNMGTTVSNTNKPMSISIANISLPSVSNGKDFVDYLQNFSVDMTQRAYI